MGIEEIAKPPSVDRTTALSPLSDADLDRLEQRVLFSTKDPNYSMDGRPLPAMTTLLHRVCGGDPDKFNEATRIVGLFVRAAASLVSQSGSEMPPASNPQSACGDEEVG